MSDETEVFYFNSHVAGEEPPSPAWELDVELGQNADQCFQRILEVVQTALLTPRERWPSDAQWHELLPSWFILKTPTISREEAEVELSTVPREQWHMLPRDFGSWLDAIYHRGWRWWSYQRTGQKLTIYLVVENWPASLEAFEHILQAAGATITRSVAVTG